MFRIVITIRITIIMLVCSTLLFNLVCAQEVKSYHFDVKIDVATKKVCVKGAMLVDFKTKDSISLALWRNSSIHSIRSNKTQLQHSFDTIKPSPRFYIQNGGTLTIIKPLKSKPVQTVLIEYDCDMHQLNGWCQSFSDDWIELNFYSAWFPINGGNFTARFNITVDKSYQITGSGLISGNNGNWQMKQNWTGFDNVIIASKNIRGKTVTKKNKRIELKYSGLSETEADSALAECDFTCQLFERLFGPLKKLNLKLVLNPSGSGGGYSRKNFISWWSPKYDFDTRCGLSHEIGHLWWTGASSTTWEDWLNESFAEYCKLQFIKEKMGLRIYNLNIDFYRKNSQGTPAIWGLGRDNPKAYTVLYQKGALILTEFEQKVGKDSFFAFLRLVRKNNAKTTKDFLALCEQHFSKELRNWIEDKLKTT
jgi:hypothetical protein